MRWRNRDLDSSINYAQQGHPAKSRTSHNQWRALERVRERDHGRPSDSLLIGDSGTKYTYFVWELPASFDANQDGNYIYCRLNSKNHWEPIYIGQGDLKDRTEKHHQAICIKGKGATHIHAHLNANEAARRAEERDLLLNYTNAYQPIGCNEKEGG